MTTFPDEKACKLYLTMHRWPDGPQSLRCGNTMVYEKHGATLQPVLPQQNRFA
jgi:hypothetical protein